MQREDKVFMPVGHVLMEGRVIDVLNDTAEHIQINLDRAPDSVKFWIRRADLITKGATDG